MNETQFDHLPCDDDDYYDYRQQEQEEEKQLFWEDRMAEETGIPRFGEI